MVGPPYHGQGNVSTSSGGGGIVLSLGGRGNRFSQKAKLPTEILPFGHHGEETGWGLSFSAAGGQKRKSLRSEFGVTAMMQPRAVVGWMTCRCRRWRGRSIIFVVIIIVIADVGGASSASIERQSRVALEFEIRMAVILKFYRNSESEFVFEDDDVNSESKIF